MYIYIYIYLWLLPPSFGPLPLCASHGQFTEPSLGIEGPIEDNIGAFPENNFRRGKDNETTFDDVTPDDRPFGVGETAMKVPAGRGAKRSHQTDDLTSVFELRDRVAIE